MNLADQALYTYRRLRMYSQYRSDPRLPLLCYRAYRRWKRRDEREPGMERPAVAGYRSLPQADQDVIKARAREATQ